ncbi:hypothetical protein ACFYO2_48250 [Streptomyces sp. NPDC006602]|uniref:hypothetical protein n=1 Tax=Streptomyces sp. NPDC006602 TaxID=3364751 RepID=UPI0036C9B434
MTIETEPRPVTRDEPDLEGLGEQLLCTASPHDLAATRALVEERSILARKNVRSALIVDSPGGASCRWENLSGMQYTLGLDEQQRQFLGLVLSMVGIGHITIAAVQNLEERHLRIIVRAILQLTGNDTMAVGTRV